jgi:hypothetical protein
MIRSKQPVARYSSGAALAGLLCLTALPGCTPPPPPPKQKPAPADPGPKVLNSQGITINWLERSPTGQAQRVMDLSAESGTITRGTQSGVLNAAQGVLYQKDVAKAGFQAPKVKASEDRLTVLASGRVKAWSLDPKGVTVTADHVTWNIKKNQVIAEGNVVFEYWPEGAEKPLASGGPVPRITIDTELKKFHVP